METLSDIVAQMRGRGEDGRMDRRLWLDYADRIEAAAKREKSEIESDALAVGGVVEAERHTPRNAAALRDAVIKALTLLNVCDWPPGVSLDGVGEVVREIDSALDKPPRKCDVGTAEEIDARWNAYCQKRIKRENCMSDKNCKGCAWRWAQTPYAEGGAE